MKRILPAAMLLCCAFGASRAQDAPRPDGVNEVLAVVNGSAVTYQEIVGDSDMQSEINAWRAMRQLPATMTDAEIERGLVYQRLESFVLQRLLDAEAKKMQLSISDTQMRQVLARERKGLSIAEDDTRAWARYCKERYNLSPTEYRERRRNEILRNEIMRWMTGVYGPIPPQYPVDIYFSLAVTPRDVRREFDKERDQYRIALDIDYRQFRLLYPQDSAFETRRKLYEAVADGDNSVHARVMRGESLEAASEGLRKLVADLGVPGVKVEMTERKTVKDDTELDPTAYAMVVSLPVSGGVSEIGSVRETDADGTQLDGFMFVRLFRRRDGTLKAFEDPKVQAAIREQIFSTRFQQNQQKVERELLRRAAIVPEKLFRR
ncbi:MAG: SurA N-terminal domain-containing protein [Planctomycetes bacterium]|nr:SurA N-terminal domain-containing protein [Planctomycetota bacterium]MCW8134687.1 SurA N-terminal domain-containing protein [Planctomycetota bacterium]